MTYLLLVLAVTSPTGDLEARATRHVGLEFERLARSNPVRDPKLDRAALTLARIAMNRSAEDATDPLSVVEALSSAGAHDPSPRLIIARGTPDDVFRALSSRPDLAEEPASHLGVAVTGDLKEAALVLLLTERTAELDALPTALSKPAQRELCATLSPSLGTADVFVTRPDGAVERLPMKQDRERWCVPLWLGPKGRHTVEILARGDRGPEVVALFLAQVGPAAALSRTARPREPSTVTAARAEILERVNALRKGSGAGAVELDPALDAVAHAYALRLAQERFFAHVAPDSSDLRSRLTAAGYPFATAGENLGMASGPIAAHFGIEHSPGHRRNLTDPSYSRLGIGVAQRGDRTLVVEVLAAPPAPIEDPRALAYRAIGEKRRHLGLRPLQRDPALEEIAERHARRALALDEPRTSLPGASVHEEAFAALEGSVTVSVDIYVADSPAQGPDSKNLSDARNNRAGVGLVRGDSKRFGPAKYWVVVVYASVTSAQSR